MTHRHASKIYEQEKVIFAIICEEGPDLARVAYEVAALPTGALVE